MTPPDAGPGQIRNLERGDIPQLVALSQKAFQRRERVAADAMTAYFAWETEFGVRVAMEEVEFDDVRTLAQIASFVAARSRGR